MSGPGVDRFTVTKANESYPIGDSQQDGYGAADVDFNPDQKKGELSNEGLVTIKPVFAVWD